MSKVKEKGLRQPIKKYEIKAYKRELLDFCLFVIEEHNLFKITCMINIHQF